LTKNEIPHDHSEHIPYLLLGTAGEEKNGAKEHPLTASEIDVEKHSPAHLNIPPVHSTSFVGKDEMTHGDGHFRELVIGWILSPFLFILPVSTLL
jgi:hypothetical protein